MIFVALKKNQLSFFIMCSSSNPLSSLLVKKKPFCQPNNWFFKVGLIGFFLVSQTFQQKKKKKVKTGLMKYTHLHFE